MEKKIESDGQGVKNWTMTEERLEKGLSDKWKMIVEVQCQRRSQEPTFKWVSEGQGGHVLQKC